MLKRIVLVTALFTAPAHATDVLGAILQGITQSREDQRREAEVQRAQEAIQQQYQQSSQPVQVPLPWDQNGYYSHNYRPIQTAPAPQPLPNPY